jgi:hypothetical protein
MNLKLVVASMSVLGLVSCPVFAATTTDDTTTTTSTTTSTSAPTSTPKHRYHHKHHHRVKEYREIERKHEAREARPDYKGMMPQEVCTITQTAVIMDETTQSIGRQMPNPCNPGWFDRIQVSGGINVDLGKWGNRNGNYMGENYQRLSLNDAYLNLAATISDWSKAFVSLSYMTATINDPLDSTTTHHVAEYDAAYSNNITSGGANLLQVDQAYATFSNFDESPIFVQVGKQYADFGRYELHPITESLTQVLSKTLATSAKIGFIVPMGFHGSLYVFDDPLAKVGQTQKPTNYGASLGIDQPNDQLGWGLGVAYLYNLIGVNDIAYNVNQFNINNSTVTKAGASGGYNTRVSGVAAYVDLNSGPFYIGARYTTAVQRFNVMDLPKDGLANIIAATGAPTASAKGAKPWAAGIQAGYGFDIWGKSQNVYLGYQASREASGLLIPKSRWLVGYGIDAWKWTSFGLEWDHDQAYGTGSGGTSNNTNLVSLRAAVEFG